MVAVQNLCQPVEREQPLRKHFATRGGFIEAKRRIGTKTNSTAKTLPPPQQVAHRLEEVSDDSGLASYRTPPFSE
jgi:hypothetical protein